MFKKNNCVPLCDTFPPVAIVYPLVIALKETFFRKVALTFALCLHYSFLSRHVKLCIKQVHKKNWLML